MYYPPFEAAVAAGAASVMCGYNMINGSWGCGGPGALGCRCALCVGRRGGAAAAGVGGARRRGLRRLPAAVRRGGVGRVLLVHAQQTLPQRLLAVCTAAALAASARSRRSGAASA